MSNKRPLCLYGSIIEELQSGDFLKLGLTQGSVLFVGSDGEITQNNSKFKFDTTNGILDIIGNNPVKLRVGTKSGENIYTGVQLYNANSSATELDYFWQGGRKMVFGYDHDTARGIFYNDTLVGGMYFFDNDGIALGGQHTAYNLNTLLIPKTWDEVICHNSDLKVEGNFYQALELRESTAYPTETPDENGQYYEDGSTISIKVRGFINIGIITPIRYYTAPLNVSITLSENYNQCYITWVWRKANGWDGYNFQDFDGYILDNGYNTIEVGDVDYYDDYGDQWTGDIPDYNPLYNCIISEWGDITLKNNVDIKGNLNVGGDFTITGVFNVDEINSPLIDMSDGLYQIYYTDEYSPRMRFASTNEGDVVYEYTDEQASNEGRIILQLGKSGEYGFQFIGMGSEYAGTIGEFSQAIPRARLWQLKANDGGAIAIVSQWGDMLFTFGDLESGGYYTENDMMFFDNSELKGQLYRSMGFSMGSVLPTAKIHIGAGTINAGSSPIKLTAGVNMTTPEAGAIEWDGTNLYITQTGGARKTLAFV